MQIDDISKLPPKYQEQILRKLGQQGKQNMTGGSIMAPAHEGKSKYHSEKTEVQGIRFDSKKEARRFLELREMENRGEISDLRLQVNFTLIEGYTKSSGERVRPEVYKADFTYKKRDENGSYSIYIVEDVKSAGTRTEKYRIKKKQMWEKFNIEIQEV